MSLVFVMCWILTTSIMIFCMKNRYFREFVKLWCPYRSIRVPTKILFHDACCSLSAYEPVRKLMLQLELNSYSNSWKTLLCILYAISSTPHLYWIWMSIVVCSYNVTMSCALLPFTISCHLLEPTQENSSEFSSFVPKTQ